MLKLGKVFSTRLARTKVRVSVRASPKRMYSTGGPSQPSNAYTVGLVAGGVLAGLVGGSMFSPRREAPAANSKPSTSSTLLVDDIVDPQYAGATELQNAIAEIKAVIGQDHVHEKGEILTEHNDSVWQTRHARPNEVPNAVVYPKDTKEVSEVLKICHKYRVPVIPFSGGTSLEGHFTPVYQGITVDVSRLDQILAVHKDDLDVVVQPAVGWEVLADALSEYKLMFGPDPGPGAEIGGMVGTGCSGTNAYRYGTMRENVVNLTVVLADGTIVKTRRRPRKSSAGYSLTEMFIGSEGTLGIVTEATLKVFPVPPIRRVGLLTFTALEDATSTVTEILQSGLNLDAIELMDDVQMKLINQAGTTDSTWAEKNTLLLRFAGTSEDIVKNEIETVKQISRNHNSVDLKFAKDADESEEIWSARKNALWSTQAAAPPGSAMWTTDVAVPISQLSTIVHECKQNLAANKLLASIIGHVGDGNFHACVAYNPKDEAEKKRVEEVVNTLISRAIELDGTCTGEHGVGMGKRHFLLEELGPDAVGVMRKVKAALDPECIMNPGHVFQTSHNNPADH